MTAEQVIEPSPEERKILEELSDQLGGYREKVEPALGQHVAERLEPMQEALLHFDNLIFTACMLVDREDLFPDDPPDWEVAIRYVYARALSEMRAIRATVTCGSPADAGQVLRSLFETQVLHRLLLRDNVEENCQLFLDHAAAEKWLNMKSYEEAVKDGLMTEEDFRHRFPVDEETAINDAYEVIKPRYGRSKPFKWCAKLFPDKRPQQLSIKFLAKDVGLADLYLRIYGGLSIAVHPSPLGIRAMGGRLSVAPEFPDQSLTVLGLAGTLFQRIVLETLAWREHEAAERYRLFLSAVLLSLLRTTREVS